MAIAVWPTLIAAELPMVAALRLLLSALTRARSCSSVSV
jgi:hypothetical protein